MADEKDFERKMQRAGTLVDAIESMPDPACKAQAREAVQLLMEVHGAGLERMMELIFESSLTERPGQINGSGNAAGIIDMLGGDPIVRSLLLLYSLHPDSLESRVARGVELAGLRLRKVDASLELVSLNDGAAQLRLHVSGHACGSTKQNLQSIVEECLYQWAPELASIGFLDATDPSASGFVPLDRLLKHAVTSGGLAVRSPGSASVARSPEVEGAL